MNNISIPPSYPLHVLISTHNFSGLDNFLRVHPEYDINTRDDLNFTPLQLASFLGETQMVKLLLDKGADISAQGAYTPSFSALTLAVMKDEADIVKMLIEASMALGQQETLDIGHAILYNLDNLFMAIKTAEDNPASFEPAFEIFLTLIGGQKLALVALEEYFGTDIALFSEPATVWLESLIRYASTPELAERLQKEVDRINAHDSCYDTYVAAKLLLHVLPVNYLGYTLTYYTSEGAPYVSNINPYGFMSCFTTPFVSQEIDTYLNTLDKQWTATWDAFYDLSEIYHQAIVFSQEQGIFENSVLAYNLYQQGKTLLLASGWDGHAINIILEPEHDYFIVANAGERYDALEAGAHIYQMHNPENLNAQFIYNILNNTDEMDLELVYKYELALDKVTVLSTPEQIHGNCAWYSHKPAIEALLYLAFLKQGFQAQDANALAHSHYSEWDSYEMGHELRTYFDNNPTLSIDAVLDILIDYQPTLFIQEPGPINLIEYQRAEYLTSVLAKAPYQSDFYDHFSWKLPDAKPELLTLFKQADLIKASIPTFISPPQAIPDLEWADIREDMDSFYCQAPTLNSVLDSHLEWTAQAV